MKQSVVNYETLLKYYNLKNLTRYNQRVRVKDESVAEHSYFVTLFTKMICKELNVDKDVEIEALTYAIVHDLPEIHLSDVPHPVKANNPQLDGLLLGLEDSIMKLEYPEYYDLYKNITSGKSPLVDVIVKTADILSVIQYASLELRLGNKGAMDILSNGVSRYYDCKKALFDLTGISITVFEGENENE